MVDCLHLRQQPGSPEHVGDLLNTLKGIADNTAPRVLVVRTMSKSQLAALFGFTSVQLRRELKVAGLDFGRRKLLRPIEVRQVFDHLGPPYSVIE